MGKSWFSDLVSRLFGALPKSLAPTPPTFAQTYLTPPRNTDPMCRVSKRGADGKFKLIRQFNRHGSGLPTVFDYT